MVTTSAFHCVLWVVWVPLTFQKHEHTKILKYGEMKRKQTTVLKMKDKWNWVVKWTAPNKCKTFFKKWHGNYTGFKIERMPKIIWSNHFIIVWKKEYIHILPLIKYLCVISGCKSPRMNGTAALLRNIRQEISSLPERNNHFFPVFASPRMGFAQSEWFLVSPSANRTRESDYCTSGSAFRRKRHRTV